MAAGEGPAPRGPSFGDGIQVGNVAEFACATSVPVGTLPISLSEPSRIWVNGQGTVRRQFADASTYSLAVRLRDAADTTTLAESVAATTDDRDAPTSNRLPLATGGILRQGDRLDLGGPFTALPGDYVLQLYVRATGDTCPPGALPGLGVNQAVSLDYIHAPRSAATGR